MLLARLSFAISLFLAISCSKESKTSKEVIIHLRELPQSSLVIEAPGIELLGEDSFGKSYRLAELKDSLKLKLIEAKSKQLWSSYELPSGQGEYWIYPNSEKLWTKPLPVLPRSSQEAVIYFQSNRADIDDWGLHVWDFQSNRMWTSWQKPLSWLGVDEQYGAYTRIELPPSDAYLTGVGSYNALPRKLGLIVHKQDTKSSDQDIVLDRIESGNIIFLKDASSEKFCSPDFTSCSLSTKIEGAYAHLLSQKYLALGVQAVEKSERLFLVSSDDGGLNGVDLQKEFSNLKKIELKAASSYPADLLKTSVQLSRFPIYELTSQIDSDALKALVKSELLVVKLNSFDRVSSATRVQLPALLDRVYSTDANLGIDVNRLRAWAPTAKEVKLKVYDKAKKLLEIVSMIEDDKGLWSTEIKSEWMLSNLYYRFETLVFHPVTGRIENFELTDPYSVSLSVNSEYSQFVDLKNDLELQPPGWKQVASTPIERKDISIYEAHVRDFSSKDTSIPEMHRAGYLAFTYNGLDDKPLVNSVSHLKELAEAGLTHIQLLPVYDFATVNENTDERINLNDPVSKMCVFLNLNYTWCSDSSLSIEELFEQLQVSQPSLVSELNEKIADQDAYNWGYDPFHYGVPEGSYSSDPDSKKRILEFRQMVQSLKAIGLNIALDVVYNHTFSSGIYKESVLDKIVPAYYHRYNPYSGVIENSTCCANTASERVMMEKLMIDTLKRWVDEYKVDAFRFDLMGHHMLSNMLNIKEVLGDDVFLYGEGWDFGEVAGGAYGENASQRKLFKTGIASFNDRFRDSIRGGSPYDCGFQLYNQGYGNGLSYEDNQRGGLLFLSSGTCAQLNNFEISSEQVKRQRLLASQDLLRLSLIGNLRDISFETWRSQTLKGSQLSYNGSPAGYTYQASESINYVQNHDNQSWWDINQMKLSFDLSMEERVRVHNMGLSMVMLSAGIPYVEMGTEILRSRSLQRDTYNSGDWVNGVDFSLMSHNWKKALETPAKEPNNQTVYKQVVEALDEAPGYEHMIRAKEHYLELLKLRYSSNLFRLNSQEQIESMTSFLSESLQEEGLIALKISDQDPCQDSALGGAWSEALILFNFTSSVKALSGLSSYRLHPVLADSNDPILSEYSPQSGMIPARTTIVLVKEREVCN